MTKSNGWELFIAHRFKEAVKAFSKELAEERCTPTFNNRGLAYLKLGKFDRALADFRAAIEISEIQLRTKSDTEPCGVALWLAGRYDEAVQEWMASTQGMLGGRIGYGDLAGGVSSGLLLWFAAVRLKHPEWITLAEKLFRKKAKGRRIVYWPGPLAQFLLGTMSVSERRSKVSDTPILRERECCQLEFYVATKALAEGNRAAYRKGMRRAEEFGEGTMIEDEYYLAGHESVSRKNPK